MRIKTAFKLITIFLNQFDIRGQDTIYLFIERFIAIFIGFFVSIAVMRYLGPEQFGVLSYANSWIEVIAPIASMGLAGPLVKFFIVNPKSSATIIKKIIVVRFFVSFVASIFAVFLVWKSSQLEMIGVNNSFDNSEKIVVLSLILSLQYFGTILDVFDSFNQAHLRFKKAAIARMLAMLSIALLRVFAILSHADVTVFAALISAQTLISGILLYFASGKDWHLDRSMVAGDKFKNLFLSGVIIIGATTLNSMQARIEIFLLGKFVGMQGVGTYSAALKFVELLDVFGVIFFSLYLPRMIANSTNFGYCHDKQLIKCYRMAFILYLWSIPLLIFLSVFSYFIFSDKYSDIHFIILAMGVRPLLTFLGIARGASMLVEDRLKYGLVCSAMGFLVAFIVGWITVPIMGIMGAILSSNLSYLISNFAIDFIFKRRYFNALIKSIYSPE